MSKEIEQLAEFTVAKACGFAMLAIGCMMVGLSFEPVQSLRVGAALSMLTCLILLLKAAYAAHKPYRKTELWLLLKPADRPPANIAQAVLSRALKQAFIRFALYFAAGTAALAAMAFCLAWLGR